MSINTQQQNERLMKLASWASVATATLLIIIKIIGWQMTDSVSVLAALIDSLLDVAASIVNLLAIRYALMPADDDHRFGHGKAEALAGLSQSTFIAGSALFLFLQAFDRLFHGTAVEQANSGIIIMLISMGMTLLLVLFQKYVVSKTRSTAIQADSLHYVGDILANAGVIVALWLSQTGIFWIDPVLAMLIGLYILHGAWGIGSESFAHLMDKELPDAEKNQIREIVLSDQDVYGVHELRTRQSGPHYIIQLHLEMRDDMRLDEAHIVADRVEKSLKDAFPGADVITHQDPVSVVGKEQGQRIEKGSIATNQS
ncbi:MAG: cation diffusion facilitator family transporter [bacterium]